MTETHISWERIRALRAAGVLADFRPRTLYGSDQPILLVHCGDHRLLRDRHEFLRDGGIAFNSWSFPGGILNAIPCGATAKNCRTPSGGFSTRSSSIGRRASSSWLTRPV